VPHRDFNIQTAADANGRPAKEIVQIDAHGALLFNNLMILVDIHNVALFGNSKPNCQIRQSFFADIGN
jgi:hypothetical protein